MKYLKDIKGVLKTLVPFSNFPYGEIKKRFSQKKNDKISLEDKDFIYLYISPLFKCNKDAPIWNIFFWIITF